MPTVQVPAFEELAAEFLARQKIALRHSRWQVNAHPDFASTSFPVAVGGSLALRGRVIITAHLWRQPPKYCFSLTLRNQRLVGLDVNPARGHRNLFGNQNVTETHWQHWPLMEAVPDPRNQPFSVWVYDFLQRSNVKTDFRVKSPPFGAQLEFPQWRRW